MTIVAQAFNGGEQAICNIKKKWRIVKLLERYHGNGIATDVLG